jgi:hypothetical protein
MNKIVVLFALALLPAAVAHAGEGEYLEHTVIVGGGGAIERDLAERSTHAGANAFLEYEAIEGWLELELGISLLAIPGGTELPIDLLVKKPFSLTRHLELMIGVGPQIVRVFHPSEGGTFLGVEFALDFMYWPTRRVGLWMQPAYGFVFRGSGGSSSLGTTAGIIVGW